MHIGHGQYGGMPGSGTSHFLIELWDRILRSIDTPDTAAALLSVDFSKAFNRMNHWICLEALRNLGASTNSLAMVASFLTGRTMRFKVNGKLSTSRRVLGGSPQGTKIGNFLFIVTINEIEKKTDTIPPTVDQEIPDDDQDCYGLRRLAG